MTQFVAAIDGCVIERYNKDRVSKEQISVRYVFGPKKRVMYDIVNRAQNLTLPIVAINVTSVSRDPKRVFNKQDNFYYNDVKVKQPGTIYKIRTPIPIQISIGISILAGYQLDLEQIASNFMAYFNPYIILATKVPEELSPEYGLEIRTKATWDGSLNISTPTDLNYSDKFRRIGDANFTLDAWIFPEVDEHVKPIYFIDTNFYTVSEKILTDSMYSTLSGYTYTLSSYGINNQHTDTISVSGTPTITNIFDVLSGDTLCLDGNESFYIGNSKKLLLYGKRFDHLDYVLLSSNVPLLTKTLTSFNSTYYGVVSGYLIDKEILNKNMINVYVNDIQVPCNFTIITYNAAGWSNTYDINQSTFSFKLS